MWEITNLPKHGHSDGENTMRIPCPLLVIDALGVTNWGFPLCSQETELMGAEGPEAASSKIRQKCLHTCKAL